MLISWFDKYIEHPDRFPRPAWELITNAIEQHIAQSLWNEAWREVSLQWLQKIAYVLGEDYHIHESTHFLLLTDETRAYVDVFLSFLEQSLQSIGSHLPGIVQDARYGKHVVIIFDSEEQYYPYIAHFYPKTGEFALSGGVFINKGYGHFVFPHQELGKVERIAAHELTHACLMHLPLPLWLNEGIAATMEALLTDSSPLRCNQKFVERHRTFWGNQRIQQFWSGTSFSRPDEGQELSYHLARLLTKALSHDYTTFRQFVLTAQARDSGETALAECFGGSLGDVVAQFLGAGDWRPAPEYWGKNKKHRRNQNSAKRVQTSSKRQKRVRHKSPSKSVLKPSKKHKHVIREKGWRGRVFQVIMGIVILAPIFIFSVLFPVDSFEKSGEYPGKVSGLYQPQTEHGSPTRFLITLDNGKIVDVDAALMGTFQKGKKVIVEEWTSKWFRRVHYKFVRYIEPSYIEIPPLNEGKLDREWYLS